MTIAQWLDRREPGPAALAERVRGALGPDLDADAADACARCLAAAERVLTPVLAAGCADRDQALDLLTVDALVTYAFEAAGEHGSAAAVEGEARRALTRFAALVPAAGARGA